MATSELEEDTFKGKLELALWRRIIALARPHYRALVWLMLFAVLIALLDTFLPIINGKIIDLAKDALTAPDAGPLKERLWLWAGLFLAFVIAFSACIWVFIVLAGLITARVSYDLRSIAFAHLQRLSFSFFDRKAVGWLMARLTSDVSTLSQVMGWALLDIMWGVTVVLLSAVAMFILNWKLALIVLLIVPPLALISWYFQRRLLRTNRALKKVNSLSTASFNEAIQGVRTSKSMSREHRNSLEFAQLTGEQYAHAFQAGLLSAVYVPLVTTVCAAAVALALWRGGIDVTGGKISFGTLVTFLQYAQFLAFPIQQLAQTITQVLGAQASAERVVGLLDTTPDIADGPDTRHDNLPARIDEVRFENVSFGYLPGQTVLRDFSLTIPSGMSVALVGPTGGGKSTIVSLACRFYQPTSGRILVNGIDYRTLPLQYLQSRLGMVLQQPHLFSGTIRDNIRYGRLDATDAEVEHAARLAGAHDFIATFKDVYDTRVGEGGNRLSTGQKQLISLARAIIANPAIFVMDEATSSVDTATERAIQNAVDRMLRGRISFVIAHRLSTIRRADLILVISGGRVIEQGSHHDLLAQRGKYFELYTNQFTQEHEEELLHAEEDSGAPQNR
jgi:ATP-binding cassette, subfamily B, bacterial